MTAEDLVCLIGQVGYAMWNLALSATPKCMDTWRRMSTPHVGDLVIEITTPGWNAERVGILRRDLGNEGCIIERLDTGGEVHWRNAKFVAIQWPSE